MNFAREDGHERRTELRIHARSKSGGLREIMNDLDSCEGSPGNEQEQLQGVKQQLGAATPSRHITSAGDVHIRLKEVRTFAATESKSTLKSRFGWRTHSVTFNDAFPACRLRWSPLLSAPSGGLSVTHRCLSVLTTQRGRGRTDDTTDTAGRSARTAGETPGPQSSSA